MDDDDVPCCVSCCVRLLLIGVLLTCVLVPAFGVVYPVRATVKDASVSRLFLNGTALEYDVSLTVSLRNRNWAMRAEHARPLYADLLFAGRLLERARLADADSYSEIDPRSMQEFRLRAVSSSSPPQGLGIELSSDEAVQFAWDTVAGFAEFELRLVGAFDYRPVHVGGSRMMDVRCPLKFPVAVATPPPSLSASVGTHFMSTVFDKISIRCY